jgi:hypothetical protein
MKLELTQEDARRICAVALVASGDKHRVILKAVLLEPDGTVVATDSYRLAYCEVQGLVRDDSGAAIMLPAAELSKALAPACKSVAPWILSVEGSEWSVTVGTSTTTGRLIEGTFPSWRQLIPGEPPATVDQSSGHVAAFDPMFLATLAKIATTLAGSTKAASSTTYCAKISAWDAHRGVKPAVFKIGPVSYLLMPVRIS